jgi:FHA domain
VAISPQAFTLLTLLVAARPRPVSQARLRDELWPGTHVSHTSLPRVVSETRRAIGDTARTGGAIRTVSRFGYAFAAAVVVEDGPDAPDRGCALVAPDREYLLPEGRAHVGRGPECAVRIVSVQASRVHAHVDVTGGRAIVEDNHSKNGTWVNGHRIAGPTALEEGDEVLFGTFRVIFRGVHPQSTTRTADPSRARPGGGPDP